MNDQLKKRENPGLGLRRLLLGAMRGARREARHPGGLSAKGVHRCRRRCKQARALLRLGRSAMGGAFEEVDRAIRAVARAFSSVRDDKIVADTLRRLGIVTRGEAGVAAPPRASVASAPATLDALEVAIRRIETRDFSGLGGKGLWSALRESRQRARAAWRTVCRAPDAAAYHRLRRRANVYRHQLHALEKFCPREVAGIVTDLNRLVAALGRLQDLQVLRERFPGDEGFEGLGRGIDAEANRYRRKIGRMGGRVFDQGRGKRLRGLRRRLNEAG